MKDFFGVQTQDMTLKTRGIHDIIIKNDDMKYFVYILECRDSSLYTGITSDLNRRMKEHLSGRGGRYTSTRKAVKIRYSEVRKNRSSALKREAEIKSWPRARKLALIMV